MQKINEMLCANWEFSYLLKKKNLKNKNKRFKGEKNVKKLMQKNIKATGKICTH